MPNKNYIRSRAKEQQLVNKYRELGWYATRTPQSKTAVDVIAIKPASCPDPNHFEVLFHQFKVSENRVNEKVEPRIEDIPFPVNILWHLVPVKSAKWKAERKAVKKKKLLRKTQSKSKASKPSLSSRYQNNLSPKPRK